MALMKISSTTCYVAPFTTSPPLPQSESLVQARLGRTGGAGVLERPGLDQSQTGQEPSVEEGGEMGKLSQRRISGGGDRYRVLLLDHEKHTEGRGWM
ncbi:hypothetical protein GOP47_0000411 [Adiantum capillus-veneris]|uniref:Uncharacterized protein n=1 Tax=Adiantum capillus-veneris TaxID=13818 RepID=A0A9D4VDH6_ADICA|nr:hypothetical protein GOP47_0000411 [Adiantum capillus-veneris]